LYDTLNAKRNYASHFSYCIHNLELDTPSLKAHPTLPDIA